MKIFIIALACVGFISCQAQEHKLPLYKTNSIQKVSCKYDGLDSAYVAVTEVNGSQVTKITYLRKNGSIDQVAFVLSDIESYNYFLRTVKSFATQIRWNEYVTNTDGVKTYYRFSPQRENGKYYLWIDNYNGHE